MRQTRPPALNRQFVVVIAEQFEAGIHYIRCIKLATVFFDLCQGQFQAQPRTIGTVRAHRLYHIGHSHDSSFEQDGITLEPLRVA